MPTIAAAWAAMIGTLASQADVDMDNGAAMKLAIAILLSIASFAGGAKLAVQAFSFTGVGTIPAMVATWGINGVMTYLTGRAAALAFLQWERGESIEDLARSIVGAVLVVLGLKASDHVIS